MFTSLVPKAMVEKAVSASNSDGEVQMAENIGVWEEVFHGEPLFDASQPVEGIIYGMSAVFCSLILVGPDMKGRVPKVDRSGTGMAPQPTPVPCAVPTSPALIV